jgi:hypothetical protein
VGPYTVLYALEMSILLLNAQYEKELKRRRMKKLKGGRPPTFSIP